jgi:serine/threonine protein kinase
MSASAPPPVPPSAEQLDDELTDYTVRRLLGQGGMGAVYLAHHTTLDRDVAIKLLPAELAVDESFVRRFEREARSMARMDHPHIVKVHDFGRTRAGLPYLVMEYVDGCDLQRLIQQGQLTVAQALQLVTQICDALSYAHAAGIVHRDIKPSNVLIDRAGVIKIADFGLARPMNAGLTAASRALTQSGAVLGTLEYMAPEQLMGKVADHRADIYALGVMLYELLTGDVPRGAWRPPSGLKPMDERLDAVVQRALQPKPEDRYQQAAEVKRDVTGVLEARQSPPPLQRSGSGKWLWLGLGSAAVATLVLVLMQGGQSKPVGSTDSSPQVTQQMVQPVKPPTTPVVAVASAQTVQMKKTPTVPEAAGETSMVLSQRMKLAAEGSWQQGLRSDAESLQLHGKSGRVLLRKEEGTLDLSSQADSRWQVQAELGAENAAALLLTLRDAQGRARSWRLKPESFNVGSARVHTHYLTLNQADYVNAEASFGPKMEDHGFDLSQVSAVILECREERTVEWRVQSIQLVR